jgi:hypothetical protein
MIVQPSALPFKHDDTVSEGGKKRYHLTVYRRKLSLFETTPDVHQVNNASSPSNHCRNGPGLFVTNFQNR